MLEAFHQECIKEITKITIESGAVFIANGTVIRSAGWRSVFNETEDDKKDEDNPALPKVAVGIRTRLFTRRIASRP